MTSKANQISRVFIEDKTRAMVTSFPSLADAQAYVNDHVSNHGPGRFTGAIEWADGFRWDFDLRTVRANDPHASELNNIRRLVRGLWERVADYIDDDIRSIYTMTESHYYESLLDRL